MAIPVPTVDDFTESTVMQECRRIVEYIIDTLVPAINEGGGGSSYVLPPATKSTLGGIIVGNNLTVDGSGKVNAPTPYTLPIGGTNIGGVKNGGNVTIESDGTMNADSAGDGWQLFANHLEPVPIQYGYEYKILLTYEVSTTVGAWTTTPNITVTDTYGDDYMPVYEAYLRIPATDTNPRGTNFRGVANSSIFESSYYGGNAGAPPTARISSSLLCSPATAGLLWNITSFVWNGNDTVSNTASAYMGTSSQVEFPGNDIASKIIKVYRREYNL